MEDDAPVTPPPLRAAPRSRKRVLLELFIVTAGVLIALLLEGLLEWNHYRALVSEARETLAREIDSNRREVEDLVATAADRTKRLETARHFADQLLATGTTEVRELDLGFALADLSSSAWRSAEQTGALAHMDYDEVQRYARLYSLQQLFEDQQRRTVESMTTAISLMAATNDPTKAAPDDLKVFRQRVLDLTAQVFVEHQLAERLVKRYVETLQQQ